MGDAWQDYFEKGEKLIWEGVPKKGGGIGLASLALAVFGLPFLAAGIATTGGGISAFFGLEIAGMAGGLFIALFGLPFLAFGLGAVFGPLYFARNRHRKVRYALSDRRAYIASSWWGRKMEVFPIAKDGAVEVRNGDTVYFNTVVGVDSDGDKTTERKGFVRIENAGHVYKLIRKIQAGEYERFR